MGYADEELNSCANWLTSTVGVTDVWVRRMSRASHEDLSACYDVTSTDSSRAGCVLRRVGTDHQPPVRPSVHRTSNLPTEPQCLSWRAAPSCSWDWLPSALTWLLFQRRRQPVLAPGCPQSVAHRNRSVYPRWAGPAADNSDDDDDDDRDNGFLVFVPSPSYSKQRMHWLSSHGQAISLIALCNS